VKSYRIPAAKALLSSLPAGQLAAFVGV